MFSVCQVNITVLRILDHEDIKSDYLDSNKYIYLLLRTVRFRRQSEYCNKLAKEIKSQDEWIIDSKHYNHCKVGMCKKTFKPVRCLTFPTVVL